MSSYAELFHVMISAGGLMESAFLFRRYADMGRLSLSKRVNWKDDACRFSEDTTNYLLLLLGVLPLLFPSA